MDQKMSIQKANKLLRELVCENLSKEIKDLHEMFYDTEEWILFLTAVPSNSESKNRFPMTPSDVSRTRKRVKVETIVESVEEDKTMPMPETQPAEAKRRGSRTASKLASLKMKEPNLTRKLRQPGNSIPEEDAMSQVLPPKRARKGKSNMPKTLVTPESSFVSSRDSLTLDLYNGDKRDPIETEDDVIFKKIQSTKISTFDNCTKKSSLRVKTVTVTRSSKRVTKQLIKTVVEKPARCMVARKSSTEKKADSPDSDSDDNIPIINLVTNTKKPEKTHPRTTMELTKKSKSSAGRGRGRDTVDGQVPILLHSVSAISQRSTNLLIEITDTQENAASFSTKFAAKEADVAEKNCGNAAADLRSKNLDNSKTLAGIQLCEVAPAEDTSIVDAHIVRGKTKDNLRSKPLSNATNLNTSQVIKNLVNQNLDPVSLKIKDSVEDIKQEPFVEPVAPAKPGVPLRMTRTKLREMMASLTTVTSHPAKKTTQKIETSHFLKIAHKSLMIDNNASSAKEHGNVEAQKSVKKERTPLNTSPPPAGTKSHLPPSIRSTNKTRTEEQENFYVHHSQLLAQMSTSKQPLVNINTNISTFLPKTKVVSAAEKAEEKRKEERRQRRENNDNALLKKKALIEDRTEQQRKKREEKERNVLAQKALKEREMAEMKMRIEKENEEKARLVQEREEMLKKEILRRKEEAKQKAAKIEERRVRQETERLQALKLQEEEQQKLLAQKKKEQEDAERLHAKRMHEEKERKEKEAAQKEAALKLEKQNQIKNVPPTKTLDATFDVEKPILIAASKYDYPLLDLSKGNDSDFSDAEEEVIPSWAQRGELVKNLKICSGIPIKGILCYFGSKPTTPDLNEIFPNKMNKYVRSSSALWKTPPRCSMVPQQLL